MTYGTQVARVRGTMCHPVAERKNLTEEDGNSRMDSSWN